MSGVGGRRVRFGAARAAFPARRYTVRVAATAVLGLLLLAALFTRGRAGVSRSLRVAALFALAGLASMGLPGALLFEAAEPGLDAVFGADAVARLPAPALWPAALYLSLAWPLSLVAAERLVAATGLRGVSGALLFAAATALGCFLLTVGVYLLSCAT